MRELRLEGVRGGNGSLILLSWRHIVLVSCSIAKLEKELKDLGGDIKEGRGSLLHLILTLCRKLEEAFAKIVDGGRDGESWRGSV
jgi:hypothetical protein